MSYFGNVFDFERSNLGTMWNKVKQNPEQLLLGAADPIGAKFWSGITGKHYSPIVDQMGGATPDAYSNAQAQGVDTKDGRQMQNAAHVIAAIEAGGYGAGSLGGGGATATPSASPAAGASGGFGGLLSNVSKGMSIAQMGQGMLGGNSQPVQAQQSQQRQGPDMSGLLNAQTQQQQAMQADQQRRLQQQQMVMQGLLGGRNGVA